MTNQEPMTPVQLFLVHAIELEREAARCYQDLTTRMEHAGNTEVAAFFSTMGVFARRHLEDAMLRGGFHETPHVDPRELRWPGGVSPEAPVWQDAIGEMDVQAALILALDGEHRSFCFYRNVSERSGDPDVQRIAAEFAAEESEHVAQLQGWLARVPVTH